MEEKVVEKRQHKKSGYEAHNHKLVMLCKKMRHIMHKLPTFFFVIL